MPVIEKLSLETCFSKKSLNTLYQDPDKKSLLISGKSFKINDQKKCSVLIEALDKSFFKDLEKASGVSLFIIYNNQSVLETDESPAQNAKFSLLSNKQGFDKIEIENNKHYLSYFALPSEYNQAIFLGILSQPIGIKFLLQKSLIIIILSLIIFSIIGSMSFMIIRTLTKPLNRMVSTMTLVSQGNFDYKSNIKKGPQEIIFLSYQLDAMIVRLQEVRTKEQKLNKAQSEFLSVAAHQLRTPLTAVRWAFSGVLVNPHLDKEVKDILKDGHKNTKRSLELVDDLLNVLAIKMDKMTIEPEAVNWLEYMRGVVYDDSLKVL